MRLQLQNLNLINSAFSVNYAPSENRAVSVNLGLLTITIYSLEIFTALHGMQTRSSDENSVCPSVRLSVSQTRTCIL